jgi:hypothetical protein
VKEVKIVAEMQIIGIMHELYPKARPWIILMAAPDLQALARF